MAAHLHTTDSSAPNTATWEETLHRATQALRSGKGDRPSSQEMVTALVKTEQACKQHRTSFPAKSLLGKWRFRFGAGKTSREKAGSVEGKGFYVPGWVKAHIAFELADDTRSSEERASEERPSPAMTITNSLQIGAIALQLTGPAHYLNRKNLLTFDFTQMTIMLFGKRLYRGGFPGRTQSDQEIWQRPISSLPFFAFIAMTDEYIAARGRGGGLALWVNADDS